LKVLGGEIGQPRLGDLLDLTALLRFGEEQSISSQLMHRVVTGGPREDEHDHGQEIFPFQGLHEF